MLKDKLDVLLVDDSETDVLLTEMAFGEIGLPHQLHVARDGVEGLQFLQSKHPDLILLDLNMPRMTGLEMLLEVKSHPEWRNIPVIVLTTSSAERDVWESYHRHANAYMVKPHTLPEYIEKLKALAVFWRIVERLPEEYRPEPG